MAAIAPAGFRPGWGPSRVGVEVAVSIPRSARLFTSLLALAACRQDDPGPLGPLDDLVGEVTSDGLVLRGADDTAFAGVSLEVPAGALPTGTAVTVSAVFDGTRLPAGAERVGAQFAVGLGGEVPSADLDLTLPVDAGLVDRFAQGEGDVKVWAREGRGLGARRAGRDGSGAGDDPDRRRRGGGRGGQDGRPRRELRGRRRLRGARAADVFDPRACGDAGLCGEVRATGIETDGWALAVDAAGQNVVAVRPAVQAGSIMVIAVALDTGVVTEGPALGVSTAGSAEPGLRRHEQHDRRRNRVRGERELLARGSRRERRDGAPVRGGRDPGRGRRGAATRRRRPHPVRRRRRPGRGPDRARGGGAAVGGGPARSPGTVRVR
jgi:hypothetical protein